MSLVFFSALAACVPTLDEANRPCPCSTGWQCCEEVCIPDAAQCTAAPNTFHPHQRYAAMPPGTVMDLGIFSCAELPGEPAGHCRRITDDGSLRYDARNHRFWLLGGGSTSNDSLFFFDPASARWQTVYEPTPCSARNSSNYDATLGAWTTGPGAPWPRPIGSPPKDMMVFVPELNELVFLARGAVFVDGCSTTPIDSEVGRIAHYSVDAGTWTFSPTAQVDAQPDYPSAFESWEYDPASRQIIGVGQAGLYAYDPFARTKRRVATGLDPTDTGFSNSLVAVDGGLLYFDYTRRGVYRVELDRVALHQTTITRATTTGGYPSLPQPAFAYGTRSGRVAGAVENDGIWLFDPASSTFTRSVPTLTDGGTADIGTMQMHCLDYDPVDDVFLFVTTLESGYRTWAWRPP